jgi:hypothetical protein
MALLSATAPAKTRFSLFSHEEAQHPHPHALSACCGGGASGKRQRARARVAAAMRPAKAVASPAKEAAGEVNGAASGGFARPDAFGRFGKFGGKYVPETLMHALTELEAAFHALAGDEDFQVTAAVLDPPSPHSDLLDLVLACFDLIREVYFVWVLFSSTPLENATISFRRRIG